MATFVERLQQAARHAGSGDSQADIARDLNVSRQTVNRWFVRGAEPEVELTFRMAQRYGVDPTWLRTGEGSMAPDPSGLSTEERDLIKSYRSATRQIRDVIRTMARAARKVAVVVIASTIPPLLVQPADAAVLHKISLSTHCSAIRRLIRAICGVFSTKYLALA